MSEVERINSDVRVNIQHLESKLHESNKSQNKDITDQITSILKGMKVSCPETKGGPVWEQTFQASNRVACYLSRAWCAADE